MLEKFLIGVVTKDRYNCLDILTTSLQKSNGFKLLIDASDDVNYSLHKFYNESYHNLTPETRPIVFNKNGIIRFFLQTDYDYLFIIEDDVKILDPYIFEEYISVSKEFHIPHMNYAIPNDNGVVYDFSGKVKVSDKLFGCFQFFTRECLERVGLMNEDLCHNCWEHIEHTYRIHKEFKFKPVWWHFPDYKFSESSIFYQKGCGSSINRLTDVQLKNKRVMFKALGIPRFPILKTVPLKILP